MNVVGVTDQIVESGARGGDVAPFDVVVAVGLVRLAGLDRSDLKPRIGIARHLRGRLRNLPGRFTVGPNDSERKWLFVIGPYAGDRVSVRAEVAREAYAGDCHGERHCAAMAADRGECHRIAVFVDAVDFTGELAGIVFDLDDKARLVLVLLQLSLPGARRLLCVPNRPEYALQREQRGEACLHSSFLPTCASASAS